MIPKTIVILLIIGALLRFFVFFGIYWNFGTQGLLFPDSRRFLQTGENLALGHGFSRSSAEPFIPSAHFPPVYPLLIAASLLLSNSIIPLVLLQIIFSTLLGLLVFFITKEFTENPYVPLLASTLTLFEPLMILWSTVLLTEVVTLFFLLLGFWFFIKLGQNLSYKNAALSGIFLGLSTLTRPHGQYLFFLGAIYLIILGFIQIFKNQSLAKTILKSVFIFALLFFITLSPWLIRNKYQFNTFNISTTGLRNLYSSLGTSIIAIKTGKPFDQVQQEFQENFAKKYGVNSQDILENPSLGNALAKEGIKIVKENPKATLKVLVIDLNAFFTQDLYLTYLRQFHIVPLFNFDFSPSLVLMQKGPAALAKLIWERIGIYAIIPVLGRVFWLFLNILWVTGAIFAYQKGRKEKKLAFVGVIFILYFAATSMAAGFSDYGRHRYPANPFIFILASYGAVMLYNLRKQKEIKV